MGFWDGLISGFNKASAAGRAEAQARADQEFARTSAVLTRLSQDDVDPAIRTAATSAMFEMAAGSKAPKGGFLAYLTGTQTPPSYPGVEAVMKMLGPQHVPGLTVTAPSATPPPPPAQAPSGASGAMVRGAGGPSSPSQLTTPPPPAPVGGPPSLGNVQLGVIPSTLTAGTPHQTAGATVQPHVFRTKAEMEREAAIAKEEGELAGDRAALQSVNATPQEIQDALKAKVIGRALGTAVRPQSIAGERADGTPAFGVFVGGRYLDADTMQPIPDFRPRTTTGSVSYGADREAISMLPQFGGKPYSQLSLVQRAAVDAEQQRRIGANAYARTSNTAAANADAPLSTQERFQAITRLQDNWLKLEAPLREMERQYALMQTGLRRFAADPVGGAESVRVTFEKILDPTSVVREGEYARQGTGLSLLDRIDGLYQQYFQGGGPIPASVLQEMVTTAGQFIAGMRGWNANEAARLDETARQFGLDPALIRGGVAGTGGPATPPPPPVPGSTPPPPVPTAAAPANAPHVGAFVGNEYHGDLATDQATGQRMGRGADGQWKPVFKGPDGKWYFQGAP